MSNKEEVTYVSHREYLIWEEIEGVLRDRWGIYRERDR